MTFLAVIGVATATPVAHAAFPGQNGRIAFNSDRDGDTEIYTMAPDGTDLLRLTTSPGQDYDAAWSADGRRIAFTSERDGNAEIYVMDGDGSNQRRLTALSGDDIHPSWSPDGRLVFASDRTENYDLYAMNPDGSGQTNLTNSSPDEFQPDWSPDGSRIAFSSNDDVSGRVLSMTPAGEDVRQLTTHGVSGLDWSPDGSRIVYSNGYLASVIAADGSDRQDLTGPFDDLRFELAPAWSPAGDLIAFHTVTCDYRHGCSSAVPLEVVRPDGAGRTRLLPEFGGNANPDWQPLVEPGREDYKNASKYCKALREFLGETRFGQRHRSHGACVSAQH